MEMVDGTGVTYSRMTNELGRCLVAASLSRK